MELDMKSKKQVDCQMFERDVENDAKAIVDRTADCDTVGIHPLNRH